MGHNKGSDYDGSESQGEDGSDDNDRSWSGSDKKVAEYKVRNFKTRRRTFLQPPMRGDNYVVIVYFDHLHICCPRFFLIKCANLYTSMSRNLVFPLLSIPRTGSRVIPSRSGKEVKTSFPAMSGQTRMVERVLQEKENLLRKRRGRHLRRRQVEIPRARRSILLLRLLRRVIQANLIRRQARNASQSWSVVVLETWGQGLGLDLPCVRVRRKLTRVNLILICILTHNIVTANLE